MVPSKLQAAKTSQQTTGDEQMFLLFQLMVNVTVNSSIMFKWKMVQSGLQTDLNNVLDLSIQSLAEDQGGS